MPAVLWTYSEVISASLCRIPAILWTYSESLRTVILYFSSIYAKVKVNSSDRKKGRITLLTQTAYGDTYTREGISFCWDMTLRQWVVGSRHFEKRSAFMLKGR